MLTAVNNAVKCLVESVEVKCKNISCDGTLLVELSSEEFHIATINTATAADNSSCVPLCSSSAAAAVPSRVSEPSPKKLKTDCGKCRNKRASILSELTGNT